MEWKKKLYLHERLGDSWAYVCTVAMARKYVVSVTILRIDTENLNMLLLRYVHQTVKRNVDISMYSQDQQSS